MFHNIRKTVIKTLKFYESPEIHFKKCLKSPSSIARFSFGEHNFLQNIINYHIQVSVSFSYCRKTLKTTSLKTYESTLFTVITTEKSLIIENCENWENEVFDCQTLGLSPNSLFSFRCLKKNHVPNKRDEHYLANKLNIKFLEKLLVNWAIYDSLMKN